MERDRDEVGSIIEQSSKTEKGFDKSTAGVGNFPKILLMISDWRDKKGLA